MNRREFSRGLVALGAAGFGGAGCQAASSGRQAGGDPPARYYEEPAKRIRAGECDVVVAGAGTAGVVAALAAARNGARTVLIERKGYPGGTVTEGGTALHSFYNLWKAFPQAKKRQVVRGIAQEIIDRLMPLGGCTGHAEMTKGTNYDSVCTAIDTELYKLVTFRMLTEAGVTCLMNTLLVDAIVDGGRVDGVITESRNGREAVFAKCFIDCTAFGDLAACAGAACNEPNDYPVVNSIGLANVSMEKYHAWLSEHNAVKQRAEGIRSGVPGKIVRLDAYRGRLPMGFREGAGKIGMSPVTTSCHDNYFMFIKLNFKMRVSPTDRDAVSKAELELRERQAKAVRLFRKYVPGFEKAFMTRTSPTLCIRRGRQIVCDYDVSHEDVIEGRHFDDEVMVYGFHDLAPRLQIAGGGTYGLPYKALRVKGLANLLAAGMLITSDHRAHMSTRNTVCCMGQGQGAGTAAALCAARGCGTRELPYCDLRGALERAGVYFEA